MSACPPKFAHIRQPHLRATGERDAAAAAAAASASVGDADGEVVLRDGELWVARQDRPRALHVVCVAGYVWLTQEGRAEDTVIGPGGMCVVPGEGKLVVQALQDAVVRIER